MQEAKKHEEEGTHMTKPPLAPVATWKLKWQKSRLLLLMFLPCLLYYALFKYAPMFGLVISFKNYSVFKGILASEWVGLKYYKMFFNNPDFFELIRNTFLLGFYKLVFAFPAPIILALVLNGVKNVFVSRFAQTVTYLPHFISNVVVASMALLFLSPTGGVINKLLEFMGTDAINFMGRPELFRGIYVVSEIWQHAGWEAIIYLAALAGIDPQLYEAAEMDGASRWRKLVHVTIPGISPAIVIVFLLNIGKVFEIGFEKVFLLSNPAIYETSDILSTYVYRVGLIQGNFSYGAAIDLFTSFVCMAFILSANYISRKAGDTSLW